jgi:sugar O-acyltransferase (sialic acid O-acetyltransferase NeuD family)
LNIILGASGHAREIEWLSARARDARSTTFSAEAFIAADSPRSSIKQIPVIEESKFIGEFAPHTPLACVLGIGSSPLRRRLAALYRERFSHVRFPTLIDPDVVFDRRSEAVSIGDGVVICAGVRMSTDITVGDFVHVNRMCTIGHDAVLGAYVSLAPGACISGGVRIGPESFIGAGAIILENITVCAGVTVGAGAVVTRCIEQPGIYLGVPARRLTI